MRKLNFAFLKCIQNDLKDYTYRIYTMAFYEALSDFILSLTMPCAKDGEEQ